MLRIVVGSTFDKRIIYKAISVLDTDGDKNISLEELSIFVYNIWKTQLDELSEKLSKLRDDDDRVIKIMRERDDIKDAIKRNYTRAWRDRSEREGHTVPGPFSTLLHHMGISGRTNKPHVHTNNTSHYQAQNFDNHARQQNGMNESTYMNSNLYGSPDTGRDRGSGDYDERSYTDKYIYRDDFSRNNSDDNDNSSSNQDRGYNQNYGRYRDDQNNNKNDYYGSRTQTQNHTQYHSGYQPQSNSQSNSQLQSQLQSRSTVLQNLSPSKLSHKTQDRERERNQDPSNSSLFTNGRSVGNSGNDNHHKNNNYSYSTHSNIRNPNDSNNSSRSGHNELLRFKIKIPSQNNQSGDRGTGSGSYRHTTSHKNGLSLTLPVVRDLNSENFISAEAAPSLLKKYEPGGSNLYNL